MYITRAAQKSTQIYSKYFEYHNFVANLVKNLQTMEEKKEMSINIRPEIATGKYSNLALITHSNSEVILDFAAMLPAIPQPEVISRIIMTPEHAKRLLLALKDNIDKYEAKFGTIGIDGALTINPNNLPKGPRS